ncbi:pilus assembly protein TadG-related protein [Streptomyces pilosus]|uniref:pilus assembly protein TadG-related protein n=1 Tax=Streptomyces pilosus TaxID=28893 RepID=UPI001675761D|nr:pilus assembly protein TadG-related protein [Streptomyces pilosus]
MTLFRKHGDAGQAFPIYITVVGGLLFLAFAYFAVGQAAANRNDAQTAADAAALAAAQDRREKLADALTKSINDPTVWAEIFAGYVPGISPSCWRAYQLAAQNDATASCTPSGPLSFTVEAVTNGTVGESIVPGTENKRSRAEATAVIEPRCDIELPTAGVLGLLTCEGKKWELDPKAPAELLPKPKDLFDVHLAD